MWNILVLLRADNRKMEKRSGPSGPPTQWQFSSRKAVTNVRNLIFAKGEASQTCFLSSQTLDFSNKNVSYK